MSLNILWFAFINISILFRQSICADDYVQDDAFDTVNTYRHGNFRARQTMEVSQQHPPKYESPLEDPPDYNLGNKLIRTYLAYM